ncbi:MAG: GNAT family N-acetyltransferase [Chloroflexota bacterium]
MLIREFNLSSDLAAARALWDASAPGVRLGRSDTPEELQKKIRRDPDLFLVAEDAGVLIGTVIGGFDGRRGTIYHLAVARAYRGQGVGRALMAEVERRLKEKGCTRAYLMVIKGNEAARFYENLGWSVMTNVDTFAKDL